MRQDLHKYFIIILTLLAAGTLCGAQEQGASRVFVFRYDDYHGYPDTSVQEAVLSLFRDKGIPLTVSVIPARLGNNTRAINFLVSSLGPKFEVALHGWDHSDRLRGTAPADRTEFAGLPVDEQYARIKNGISLLQGHLGIAPTTFAPPFNSYDSDTVEALQKAGIKCLSADIRPCEVDHEDVRCVPQTCLLRDIANAKDFDSGLYVVLFHEYDFVEFGGKCPSLSLEDLDSFLTRLSATPGTTFSTIASLVEDRSHDFSPTRLQAAQAFAAYPGTRLFHFPAHWVRSLPSTYETTEVYNQLLRRARIVGAGLDILAAALVLGVAVAAYRIFVSLRLRQSWARCLASALPATALIAICALLASDLLGFGSDNIGYKDRLFLSVLSFGGAGALLGRVRAMTPERRTR